MYFLTLLKKYIFKVYSLERPSARYEKKEMYPIRRITNYGSSGAFCINARSNTSTVLGSDLGIHLVHMR